MVGAGGSGKGYVIGNSKELASMAIVNSDRLIENHPEYVGNGGKLEACNLHHWAEQMMEADWETALHGSNSFILDGTGKTASNVERRVKAARKAGFQIEMVYVFVPLPICLERNAKRDRQVPESAIIDAWEKVKANFPTYRDIADYARVIHNY